MIPGLDGTPPEVALLLGFFMALSLRQGRLAAVLDKVVPERREGEE
ncbi:hypothetical protein [Halorubrum sp. LN27]|nr:hypothetical protein [Halorubrum sp. LN27]